MSGLKWLPENWLFILTENNLPRVVSALRGFLLDLSILVLTFYVR